MKTYEFLPVYCKDSSEYSVDMVRLRIKLLHGENIKHNLLATQSAMDGKMYNAQSWIKPTAIYREVYRFEITKEKSWSMGLGLQQPGKALKAQEGFVEFNPNKLSMEEGFWAWWRNLSGYLQQAEIAYWDLAVDYPVERSRIVLFRDRHRVYHYYTENDSVTEYVGLRGSAGFVKVYDKQAEAKLPTPKTRIEMKIDYKWSVDEIQKHAPHIAILTKNDEETNLIVSALKKLVMSGESIDSELHMVSWRYRKKIEDALSGGTEATLYDVECLNALNRELVEFLTV